MAYELNKLILSLESQRESIEYYYTDGNPYNDMTFLLDVRSGKSGNNYMHGLTVWEKYYILSKISKLDNSEIIIKDLGLASITLPYVNGIKSKNQYIDASDKLFPSNSILVEFSVDTYFPTEFLNVIEASKLAEKAIDFYVNELQL